MLSPRKGPDATHSLALKYAEIWPSCAPVSAGRPINARRKSCRRLRRRRFTSATFIAFPMPRSCAGAAKSRQDRRQQGVCRSARVQRDARTVASAVQPAPEVDAAEQRKSLTDQRRGCGQCRGGRRSSQKQTTQWCVRQPAQQSTMRRGHKFRPDFGTASPMRLPVGELLKQVRRRSRTAKK